MGNHFASIANTGPLLLAIGVAALAGLVSILSPCVLPLVPGYLSYVTGLAGSDLDATAVAGSPGGVATVDRSAGAVATDTRRTANSGRVLAGTLLFVLGFAVVFALLTSAVAGVGSTLQSHRDLLNVVLGIVVIVLGLGYLGWIPGMQREARIRKLPAAGLVGAPFLGAVLIMAGTSGQTDRALVLALAYSLGLGVPFVLFGLFFRKLIGVFRAIRRNSRWVTRAGGALLILIGLTLVTGGWNHFLIWLQ